MLHLAKYSYSTVKWHTSRQYILVRVLSLIRLTILIRVVKQYANILNTVQCTQIPYSTNFNSTMYISILLKGAERERERAHARECDVVRGAPYIGAHEQCQREGERERECVCVWWVGEWVAGRRPPSTIFSSLNFYWEIQLYCALKLDDWWMNVWWIQ